jgi:hypothetical protein
VYQSGCLFHVTCQKMGHSLKRTGNGLVDGNAMIRRWPFQDPMNHFGFVPRVTNAKPQAPILVCAQLRVDVT